MRDNARTAFTLDPSYYGWQGCRCQDPNSHVKRSGDGADETLRCVANPRVIIFLLGGGAAVLVAMLLCARCAHTQTNSPTKYAPSVG